MMIGILTALSSCAKTVTSIHQSTLETSSTVSVESSLTDGPTTTLTTSKAPTASEIYVYFYDGDNTKIIYGTTIQRYSSFTYPGPTPKKEPTASVQYDFIGWDKSLDNISETSFYYPVFKESIRMYTVTFLNGDNSVLKTIEVAYNTSCMTPEEIPTKEETYKYTYLFSNWKEDYSIVTSDINVHPIFDETIRTYTITFLDYDGTLIEKKSCDADGRVTLPSTPKRTSEDSQMSYEFSNWSSSGWMQVKADETIYARYKATHLYLTFEYTTDYGIMDSYYVVSKVDKEAIEIHVPETFSDGVHGDGKVVEISEGVFSYDLALTTIILPDTIMSIKANAFEHCTSLTSITFGTKILSIGESAFIHCTALKSIEFKDSPLSSISKNAFYDCTMVESIILPSNLKTLSTNSFFLGDVVTSITFLGSIEAWKAIQKDGWFNGSPVAFITCSDGQTAITY